MEIIMITMVAMSVRQHDDDDDETNQIISTLIPKQNNLWHVSLVHAMSVKIVLVCGFTHNT